MLRTLITVILIFLFFSFTEAEELYFPTFHEGIFRGGRSERLYKNKMKRIGNASVQHMEEQLANVYENALAKIKARNATDDLAIPKIIHVIWLGSAIPEKYALWQQTWKDLDGWDYRLWTDKEVEELTLINRELFNNAKNYGEKSDILRIELLYQFGGLYVDTDFACIDPAYFELFHHCLDFYIGIEPIEYKIFRMGNAIIGSCPQHPLVHKLITELPANFNKYNGYIALETTGPEFITRTIFKYLDESPCHANTLAVFPPSLFYPFTGVELRQLLNQGASFNLKNELMAETCGIHFWEGSWARNRMR